jgi:hypothetical protein
MMLTWALRQSGLDVGSSATTWPTMWQYQAAQFRRNNRARLHLELPHSMCRLRTTQSPQRHRETRIAPAHRSSPGWDA